MKKGSITDDECLEINSKLKILVDLFNLVIKSKKTIGDSLQNSTLQMVHMLMKAVSLSKGISEEVFSEFKTDTITLIQVVL